MPAWRARTAPDLLGSITKHTVSGPMKTQSHHFAGPFPSRGANTRHVVSSACRCHEPRDRSAIASASGASSAPACAHVPAKVAGEISAPCLPSPVAREFMLRPATNRSVSSIAGNPLEKSPLPIAFGRPGPLPRARHPPPPAGAPPRGPASPPRGAARPPGAAPPPAAPPPAPPPPPRPPPPEAPPTPHPTQDNPPPQPPRSTANTLSSRESRTTRQ